MLNSCESGHPCLVPDLRRNAFSSSQLRIMFAVGLSYMAFSMLSKWYFYAHFLKSFNHKWVLNFVKGFFWTYWDDHMGFIFQFVNVMYHIYWVACIEESLNSWDNPTWSWCMSFLMYYWILFAKILLKIFASMFIIDIAL